jgi:signal transduction histidine kinase
MTKEKALELSRRYFEALRSHLGARRPNGTAIARDLGRDVIASGRTARDLVRIHERSLAELAASHDFARAHHSLIRRAGKFLAAALVPVEKLHRGTRASFQQLQLRAETLRLHRAELAKANRQLRREVVRRQASEEAMKESNERNRQLHLESQIMQKKLRLVTRQVLTAQEEERRQISRELHDEVTQILIGIDVELTALGNAGVIEPKVLKAHIGRTQRLVKKSVNAVHRFARELRPAALDDLGLIPALQSFMERLSAKKKLIINLTAFAGVEALDNARRTVLYRVAQESLTNVARHARASTVNMIISEIPDAIRMEVNDDGKSFQVLKALAAKTNRRLGLLGMRERVEMVGGTLAIESAPGKGTSVRVEIPLRGGEGK